MPGNNGGANFGGVAADPAHGFLYVVSKDLPAMLKLELDQAEEPSATVLPSSVAVQSLLQIAGCATGLT